MHRKNPWQQVPLEVYEGHMSWDDVQQMQALNALMKSQWQACPSAKKAVVLGIAGGNGLEHCGGQWEKIYGIDINQKYLKACRQRFGETMGTKLELLQMDLTQPQAQLPEVDLVIADLLIEYVGIETFCRKAAASQAKIISCAIQLPSKAFVSDSPFQSGLQSIGELHRDIDPVGLQQEFMMHGYVMVYQEEIPLPNGKALLRTDYESSPEKRGQNKKP